MVGRDIQIVARGDHHTHTISMVLVIRAAIGVAGWVYPRRAFDPGRGQSSLDPTDRLDQVDLQGGGRREGRLTFREASQLDDVAGTNAGAGRWRACRHERIILLSAIGHRPSALSSRL